MSRLQLLFLALLGVVSAAVHPMNLVTKDVVEQFDEEIDDEFDENSPPANRRHRCELSGAARLCCGAWNDGYAKGWGAGFLIGIIIDHVR